MAQKTRPRATNSSATAYAQSRSPNANSRPAYGGNAEPGLRNAILGAVTRPDRSSLPVAGRLLIKFFISYMIGHLIGDGVESFLNHGIARLFKLKEGSSKSRRIIHLICKVGTLVIGNWLGNEISDVIDSYMSRNRTPRSMTIEIRQRQHALPYTAATIVRKFFPESLARRLVGFEGEKSAARSPASRTSRSARPQSRRVTYVNTSGNGHARAVTRHGNGTRTVMRTK